jgi:hypothetical protein
MLKKELLSRSAATKAWFCLSLWAVVGCGTQGSDRESPESKLLETPVANLDPSRCDIVINGGTTAAIAAALASAEAVGSIPGAALSGKKPNVCLLEPTDWTGGQLTAGMVSAVDFSWHRFQKEMRSFHNNNKYFFNMASDGVASNVIEGRNPGGCWVSAYCNLPRHFLTKLQELQNKHANLQIFRNTVVKKVTKSDTRIVAVEAIQRIPKSGGGYTQTLSALWNDMYSSAPSADFDKKVLNFDLSAKPNAVFVEASETGDFLVLSDARYLQGVEIKKNDINSNNDQCGQAFVYAFAQDKTKSASELTYPIPARSSKFYSFRTYSGAVSADRIWTYRQLSKGGSQTTLQNWNPGNDFPYDYFFLSQKDSSAQLLDWKGGVRVSALAEAEAHAFGWHQFFKNNAPFGVSLNRSAAGTAHGLAKYPYLRDIRRSVGFGGFFLRNEDIWAAPGSKKARQFEDSLGTGLYAADFHSNVKCSAPGYLNERHADVAPFTLPFLAHTNETVSNMLVAGKSMAQTYYVNGATRLQPIEWNSGWGAGVAAAHLWRAGASTWEAGLAYVKNPTEFKKSDESITSFEARLQKSRSLIQNLQNDLVNYQPIWFCNAVGRNENCVTKAGRYRLSMPAP